MKNNYHIAALGGGILVLGGLGYFGYSGNAEVNETLVHNSARKGSDSSTEGGELASGLIAKLSGVDAVAQRETSKGRPVNLFTSVDLYTRVGEPSRLIDILKVSPIHPPIENQWWVDHRVDLTWSDSPFRDEDGDGFFNGEEYQAKTDPNDAKDYGDLVTKLGVATIKSDLWRLEFYANPSAGPQFKFTFKKFGGPTRNNEIGPGNGVAEGALFFDGEPGKERFKLLNLFTKREQTSVGEQDRPYATLEDQLPNKQGKTYTFPLRPGPRERPIEADHTVVFRLNAIGEEGNLFEVQENGTFALPSGGAEKIYKLVEVTLNEKRDPVSVTVEYTKDGAAKKRVIQLPQPQS